jgi:hypothetical protein
MILSFELTMPGVASWNGKWTGEGKKYFIIKNYTARFIKSTPPLQDIIKSNGDSFYYRWEDGWAASVNVEIIDGLLAKKRRKISAGFCGYDWMVNSIITHGKIQTS